MNPEGSNPDYEELEFPRNWPNERRIETINLYLNDKDTYSVELERREKVIVLRVWYTDHMALHPNLNSR